MKKNRCWFLFFFALGLIVILSFSLVQAATPGVVLNALTMNEPYATGSHNFGTDGRRNEVEADASHDASAGIINVMARSLPSSGRTSSAWAEAYLGDAFEIVHSGDYKITFSIDYKGLISITNPSSIFECFYSRQK